MGGEKTVWVSRNPDLVGVVLTDYEPDWRESIDRFDYELGKPISIIGLHDFEAVTSLTVKPGQCLRIRLTAEVLEGEA